MKEFIINYWLQAVFAGILAVLGYFVKKLYNKINHDISERSAMKIAMIAILHDRLFQSCSYYIKLGYIPLDDAERVLDNVGMLYSSYSDLGGNGTGTELYNRMKALPLKAVTE